jgi:osmotically inducible protein OsmC
MPPTSRNEMAELLVNIIHSLVSSKLEKIDRLRGSSLPRDELLTPLNETVLRVGPLELDLIDRAAKRGDRHIDLLPREFQLLKYMMQRSDKVLSRATLLKEVWHYKLVPRTNLVDVQMGRLRHKVDGANEAPMIRSVRGVGFVLDGPPLFAGFTDNTGRAINAGVEPSVADLSSRRDHLVDPGSCRTTHLTCVHGLSPTRRGDSPDSLSHLANPSEEGISAMASLYSTKVTATGGRHGSIRSEDGLLDLKLALPRALGGMGDATNPEQLFAGGYAACFENALLHVSRDTGHRFADDDIDVVAKIDLSRNETGGFVLAAALAVTIAGIDQQAAERLVQGAHAICPYSNAIRGNVDVATLVSVR